MAVFNGEFIASCVGVDGPYILKSSDPSAGQSSFKKIATKSDLFNYPAYHYTDSIYGGSIWEMVEFNGSLYVALCTGTQDNKPDEHTMQSFAIVRGDENSDGSWTWTPVVGDKSDGARYTFGIDPERTRAGACNMLVYNDHLYIGEYEDIEIALEDVVFNKNVEFLAKNLEQSVSLYRMDKNENMELVVGDATEMFPNGGISGLGSGFGHHENQYIWQSTVYDGKMYFGTFDSSSLLEPIGQFTNGDLLNMTPEESVAGFADCVKAAAEHGIEVSGSISMPFGSPWDGRIPQSEIDSIIDAYLDVGITEISLSDTSGMGVPNQVYEMCSHVHTKFPTVSWWLHFHNTRGVAMANIMAAMEAGMTRFDTSFGGLGGCPFVPGAAGNISSEDVIHMCDESGITTGIDVRKVMAISRKVQTILGHTTDSYLLRAGCSSDLLQTVK